VDLAREIHLAVLATIDRLDPFKRYTRFTHELKSFPLPVPMPLPDPLPVVAILTPCRDAEGYLETYFALVDALDYPKDRIHLRLLEGDSRDATRDLAASLIAARQDAYASVKLIKLDLGLDLGPGRRSRPEVQLHRRSGIAACRNALLRDGLETNSDWFLCLDIDLVGLPADTLRRAIEFNGPILMANCLLEGTTAVFDLNAFRYTHPVTDRMAGRFVTGGLYQPPKGYFRHYPAATASNVLEPLHSVGGTCLLIRRDVIEAGVDFPEHPYQLHIETEGFALKAAELGFGAFSAPGLHVFHGWEK